MSIDIERDQAPDTGPCIFPQTVLEVGCGMRQIVSDGRLLIQCKSIRFNELISSGREDKVVVLGKMRFDDIHTPDTLDIWSQN